MGWVAPSCVRNDDGEVEVVGELRGYGGEPYPRLLVEMQTGVADRCPAEHPDGRSACPLVVGHVGDHWQASFELIEEYAPMWVWAEAVDS